MLVLNQKIKMTWNSNIKQIYTSKNYKFTKYGDIFFIDISDLCVGSKKRVRVICDYCGKEYEVDYCKWVNRHNKNVNHKDCCIDCRGRKISNIQFENNIDRVFSLIEKKCKENGYTLITTKDEYLGVKNKIAFLCPHHGLQHITPDSLINAGSGCEKCKADKIGAKNRHNPDDIEKIVNSFNGNILLNKQEYKSNRTKNLKIKCGGCGNVYTTSLDVYVKSSHMCPHCTGRISVGESMIINVLKSNNIIFCYQKSFDDCRNIHPLPFDFYLPDYNMCIEYDGEGHYLESFYKNRYDNPLERLQQRQYYDQIKTQYCANNNIKLLRIPYWHKNQIEEILIDALQLHSLPLDLCA